MSSHKFDPTKDKLFFKQKDTPMQQVEKIAASKGMTGTQLLAKVEKETEREKSKIITPFGVTQPRTLIIIGSVIFVLIVALILFIKLRKKK